jgi:hypothetical protein
VTSGAVRRGEGRAEVSEGRSSRVSDEGPNDRKGQWCLGLEEGIALAILLRQVLGRHNAGEAATDANPRSETHPVFPNANAQPTLHWWDQPIEPPYADPHIRWCGRAGEERRLSPYADYFRDNFCKQMSE